MSGAAVEQRDAADKAHGGWKTSKAVYLHLSGALQLISVLCSQGAP